MELSNSWILHWNMKIIKNRKTPSDTSCPHCSGRVNVFKWEVKLQRKSCFCKNTQVRVDKTQDSKRKYDLALKLTHTHMCWCELNTSLCRTNAFCLQLCHTCLMFPFLFTPVWLLHWPQLSFTANPRNTSCPCVYELSAEMNTATCAYHVWASTQRFCHHWWKPPSSTSLSTFRTAITWLLHWAQHYPDRRRWGRMCRSVVSLLKSCISWLKQVSRQFELDSDIFKPWDVFIYLVNEGVILIYSIKIRQKHKSRPGLTLNS